MSSPTGMLLSNNREKDNIRREIEMKIKLLALDVDGTLLNDQHEITERTQRVIAQMQQQGVKIVLATGRGPKSTFPLAERLHLTDPIITHNGAVIVDPLTKEISLEIGFKSKELAEVIHYCREKHIHFDVNTALDMYAEDVPEHALPMYNKFFMQPEIVSDATLLQHHIVKFTMFGNEKEIDRAFEEICLLFPELTIIRSGELFIDIMHPKATKGYALQQILTMYEILPEEVISFGNYFNDIEMLQLAGIGVAMQNSPAGVKELANYVTPSNNEDGVAEFLEKMIK